MAAAGAPTAARPARRAEPVEHPAGRSVGVVGITRLQRTAGNSAVARLIGQPVAGGSGTPVQRQQHPATAAPSPDLPAGSKWHAIAEKPLLAKLGEALAKSTLPEFTPAKDAPADLGAALELLTSAQINAAIQVYRKLAAFDLWKETGDIIHIDSVGALRMTFTSVGATRSRLEGAAPGSPLHDQFCKDTTYGASYHSGGLAWREVAAGQSMGLHVVPLDNEFHIDPHQPVTGKIDLPDYEPGPLVHLPFGQGEGIPLLLPKSKSAFLAKRCAYDLFGDVKHMGDVAGGAPVNVFTRREAAYARIHRAATGVDALADAEAKVRLATKLEPLRARLDALGPVLEGWAARGLQEGESPAAAAPVFAELTAVEKVLSDVEWDLMTPEQQRAKVFKDRLAGAVGGTLEALKFASDVTGMTPIGVLSKGSKKIVDLLNSL
jgi:hypothetical protein